MRYLQPNPFILPNGTNKYSCKFRNVDCRRGCGASIVAHQLDIHEQEHCRLSKHPCVFGCGEKVVKAEMDAHIKKVKGGRKYQVLYPWHLKEHMYKALTNQSNGATVRHIRVRSIIMALFSYKECVVRTKYLVRLEKAARSHHLLDIPRTHLHPAEHAGREITVFAPSPSPSPPHRRPPLYATYDRNAASASSAVGWVAGRT